RQPGGSSRQSLTRAGRNCAATRGFRIAELPTHLRRSGAGSGIVRSGYEKGAFIMERLKATGSTPVTDFLPLKGIDHIEFYVGNAKQAAYYYRAAFGMTLVSYRGPETGTRDRASYVLQQDKVMLVFTTALSSDHPAAAHVLKHGDGVRAIAL